LVLDGLQLLRCPSLQNAVAELQLVRVVKEFLLNWLVFGIIITERIVALVILISCEVMELSTLKDLILQHDIVTISLGHGGWWPIDKGLVGEVLGLACRVIREVVRHLVHHVRVRERTLLVVR
jgi:hypothetical protein